MYCSYKGNYNGFQYAFFDNNDIGKMEKVKSVKNTDNFPKEFEQVRDILESKRGWKLILKKVSKRSGILLISKIEGEAETKREKILEELEEEKLRNFFRNRQESNNDVSWKNIETDYFINLALVGKTEDLEAIAVHYILDMINNENYKGEETDSWLKRMEEILEKSQDRMTYLINLDKFWEWLKEIIKWSQIESSKEIYQKATPNELLDLKTKIWKRFCPYPYVRLENSDKKKSQKTRIKDIEEKIIKPLLNKSEFSEEYILIITNGGTLPEMNDANLVFDMEYLRL